MGTSPRDSGGRETGPARSRGWIVTAFNRLVLGRGYEALSVGEVSRRAGVGRSTFYEHFRDKDQLLRQALGPILQPLAEAAVGEGDRGRVRSSLEHIAAQRSQARAMLDGAPRQQVEQALADLILTRLAELAPAVDDKLRGLESARLAGSQIAVIRAWLLERGAGAAAAEVSRMLVEGGLSIQRRASAKSGSPVLKDRRVGS